VGKCRSSGSLALWEMGAPDLLDARTYAVQIYREYSANGDAATAAAMALPLMLLGGLLLLPVGRLRHTRVSWSGPPRLRATGASCGYCQVLWCWRFRQGPC